MIQFNLVRYADGNSVVSAYIDGELYTAASNQAGFNAIVNKLQAGDESVVDDFDAANFANKAFHAVTDRVSVRNGIVHLDDNPIDAAMNNVVMQYLSEGNESALPLVRFLERLDENPSFNSRDQLWRFVKTNGIHIDDDGYLIMYKGVSRAEDGGYMSVSRGTAFVNGVKHEGHIPSKPGDVVTMPRREISDNPNVACHRGLHCGARSYAEAFAPVLITVKVDPAHVVSVPTDSYDQKVRVEQYEIMPEVGARQVGTVRWDSTSEPEDDDNFYGWDDDEDEYF